MLTINIPIVIKKLNLLGGQDPVTRHGTYKDLKIIILQKGHASD